MNQSLGVLFALISYLIMPVADIKDDMFKSPIYEKPIITFGIIADVQYSDQAPAGTRYYRESIKKLEEAVNQLKKDSSEFIINLGDIIDKDFSSYTPVLQILASSGIKTYHLAGNHDYSVDAGHKNKIPLHSSSINKYYSFVQKKFRFIFLDGNEVSTYSSDNGDAVKVAVDLLSDMKKRGEKNAMDWNGGIGARQLSWLAAELDEARGNNEKVLLMCHFPVAPDNVHNLLNYNDLLALISKYSNIVAWFNGHNHAGNYVRTGLIHFVTFKGMVETENDNSFARVEVYKTHLSIKGYGREESRLLEF